MESWRLERGDELAPGRTVLQKLGGGNRYEAFLVWDERLYAVAVAKALRPHRVDDPRVIAELREEAEALERLAHPVLVRGFDAVLEGPRPHLLLEHLEGPNLRRLIRRHGAVALEQLLPLAAHVGAALHYMAGAGWAHLDVKPENIVMGVPPRLIDLSIARPVESAARIKSPIGTDAYMAPEQCAPDEHSGEIGPPSDVWGLAATLHHAVSGEPPFRRSGERFPQLREEPRALPEGAPAPLAEVLTRGLARRPADRPTAAELVDALAPLVAALPRKLTFGRRGTRSR
jgi:serine/threonine protein kinase